MRRPAASDAAAQGRLGSLASNLVGRQEGWAERTRQWLDTLLPAALRTALPEPA